jgi:1-acyl-sn-glycerol-3-phosphate acyltransferase
MKIPPYAFAGDAYQTPEGFPRAWGDRLCFGSRWWFYARQFHVILRDSRRSRLGRYDDQAWFRSSREVLHILERAGARVTIEGIDHIRSLPGPAVFVANHMSTLETFALACIIGPIRPFTFVVKKKLIDDRIFGPIMRSRNPIAVGRQDPKRDLEAVLAGGAERLSQGLSLVIFPQATRRRVFEAEQFNSLGVKVAERAGAPLVPLAIKSDFWGEGRWLRDFGPLDRKQPVHFAFGAPRPVTPQNRREIHAETVAFIQKMLRSWNHPTVP